MEFGILSSFLSFLPFLLAAGEPAAMTEELPLVSSVVTGGKGTSLMSLVSPHNLHFLWLKFHTRGADRGAAAAGVVGRGGRGGRLLLRLLRGRRGLRAGSCPAVPIPGSAERRPGHSQMHR